VYSTCVVHGLLTSTYRVVTASWALFAVFINHWVSLNITVRKSLRPPKCTVNMAAPCNPAHGVTGPNHMVFSLGNTERRRRAHRGRLLTKSGSPPSSHRKWLQTNLQASLSRLAQHLSTSISAPQTTWTHRFTQNFCPPFPFRSSQISERL
jgi:hypothetical protein